MITRLNALFTSSKWTAVVLLIFIIVPLALGMGPAINNQFWYAVNEYLAGRDVEAGVRYSIGALGIAHACMEGAIWGFVCGNVAGAVAGGVASL